MPEQEAYYGVYYEVATNALNEQMQQIDQLAAKVSTAYAAATGVLAVFAALITLAALPTSGSAHHAILACFALAGFVYLVVAVILLIIYWVRNWSYGPKLSRVLEQSKELETDVLKGWIANACAVTIQENNDKIEVKARLLNFGLMGLAVESGLLVAAVAIGLFVR